MNIKNVSKRETLTYEEFIKKNQENSYSDHKAEGFGDSIEKTGFHNIQQQHQFDYIGWTNAVYNKTSKIDYPATTDNTGIAAIEMGVSESILIKNIDDYFSSTK